MNETSKRILDAAIKVFKEKGYVSSSTKLIAHKSGVAEVTIYRKFKSKRSLFEYAVRKHLEPSFMESKLNFEATNKVFFKTLLEDRLSVMSDSRDLMALVIRESLSGNLPNDLNFTTIVFKALNSVLKKHMEYWCLKVDTDSLSRVLVGILLSYVLIQPQVAFKDLSEEEKNALIDIYVDMLLNTIVKQES
jgi:AcrR family transcriptional regulator